MFWNLTDLVGELIKKEILIATGMVWLVSSDIWKAPEVTIDRLPLMLLVAHAYLIIVTENFSSFRSSSSSSSSSSSFISLSVTANFTEYSRLLGEETSRNHQAYRKGHLDITILYPIKPLFITLKLCISVDSSSSRHNTNFKRNWSNDTW